MTDPIPNVTEKTFSKYSQSQGETYAQARRDYHPRVYETIIKQHTSTGGELGLLLDVGCGPGNVTRTIAPHFTNAIGLDPGPGMITTARSLTPADQPNVRFELSSAEELGSKLSPPIADGSIDLITAGNAAHWFNMGAFWESAARVLKPGGSVVLWTSGEIRAHPSMPNAIAIQDAMDKHRDEHLLPYLETGSLLTRGRYRDLPLPWMLEKAVEGFDEKDFVRVDWDPSEPFFTGQAPISMEMFEKMMGTGSAVTRWRDANPGAVGAENDVLRLLRRDMERILHEAGVEKGKERLTGTVNGVILIVKKTA